MNENNNELDLTRLSDTGAEAQGATEPPRVPITFRPRNRGWRRVRALILLAILTAATLAWVSAHHIIRTDEGVAVIRKRYFSLEQSLVDIRDWDYRAFQARPELSRAMTLQGYADQVKLPPPAAEETIAHRVRRQASELADSVGAGLQQAGESTRDWAQYVVDYWKTKITG